MWTIKKHGSDLTFLNMQGVISSFELLTHLASICEKLLNFDDSKLKPFHQWEEARGELNCVPLWVIPESFIIRADLMNCVTWRPLVRLVTNFVNKRSKLSFPRNSCKCRASSSKSGNASYETCKCLIFVSPFHWKQNSLLAPTRNGVQFREKTVILWKILK